MTRARPEHPSGPPSDPSPSGPGLPRWPRYVLGAALAASLCSYVPRCVLEPARRGGKDFAAYYAAAKLFARGGDAYDARALRDEGRRWGADPDRDGYGYPPFMALAAAPLTRLSFPAARIWWVGLNQAFLAGTVALLSVLVFAPGPERRLGAAMLALVAMNSDPVREHLLVGQTNLLMLLLACAALWAFRRGRPTAAGLALGAAAALKLYPIALAAYFAWKRQWRVAAAAGHALAWCTAAAVVVYGWRPAQRFVMDVLPVIASHPGDVTHPSNQSIYACFARLFTVNLYVEPVINSPIRAKLVSWVCCAALVGVTALLCRPRSDAILAEASLVVIATTLATTLAWGANFVATLLPLAVGLRGVMARSARRPVGVLLLFGAAALIHARFPWWTAANGDPRSLLLLCPRLLGSLLLFAWLGRQLRLGVIAW